MTRLAVVVTGGTIASRTGAGGARAVLSGDDLVGALPPGADPVALEVVEVCRVNGWNVTPTDMAAVSDAVRAAIGSGVDGVIVTHGTDTLEETAFATDLFCRHLTGDVPVVVTGAMLAADAVGADGLRNLAAARTTALTPASRGRGVLVVMHDEVHAARWVTKARTTGMRPFDSLGGPVGFVERDEAVYQAAVPDGAPAPVAAGPAALDERVATVFVHTGGDGAEIDFHVGRGARGLVLVGTGAGNVPGSYQPAIEAAVGAGTVVVVVSRCSGRTATIYGGPGGNATLLAVGVHDGRGLSPAKARICLMAHLAAPTPQEPFERWMERL